MKMWKQCATAGVTALAATLAGPSFADDVTMVMVPDLICLIDHETAKPVLTEALAYGQRLDIVAMPCAPEWHQPGMLDVVGPRAFGYDLDYVPLGGAR